MFYAVLGSCVAAQQAGRMLYLETPCGAPPIPDSAEHRLANLLDVDTAQL